MKQPGVDEVYVVSIPGLGGKRQVSTRGGRFPQWSAKSGELFFVSADTMMVSRVTTGDTFTHSLPRPLFVSPAEAPIRDFLVTADGQRFLHAAPNPDAAARQIHMVLNWTEELKGRAVRR